MVLSNAAYFHLFANSDDFSEKLKLRLVSYLLSEYFKVLHEASFIH